MGMRLSYKEPDYAYNIKKKKKLNEGDMVLILNKTRGETLEYTYSDGHKWKKGDVAYIYKVFLESYALTPYENHEISTDRRYGYGTFNHSDIKKISENYRHKVGGKYIKLENNYLKEKEMKYKAGNKTLVVEPLKGQMTKGSTPSHAENNSFLTTMIRDFNYSYGDGIPINDKFIEYIEQHKCFIEWLLVNDFIEKVIEPFKPFYITLKINSAEEYWTLWHRLNVHLTDGTTLEEYLGRKRLFNGDNLANRQNLWDTVDNHKKKVKEHYSPNENNAK